MRVLFHCCHREGFVPEIKEKLCYIGLNFDTKHKSPAQVDKEKTYAPPDSDIITVAQNVSVSRKCCSSHTAPIYDGSALHHAILRSAGCDLTVDGFESSFLTFTCTFRSDGTFSDSNFSKHMSTWIGHKSQVQVL